MNLLEGVAHGRHLVSEADRRYVGDGALATHLLDLIGVSRLRGKRVSQAVVQAFGTLRGLDKDDIKDLGAGLRAWRR